MIYEHLIRFLTFMCMPYSSETFPVITQAVHALEFSITFKPARASAPLNGRCWEGAMI